MLKPGDVIDGIRNDFVLKRFHNMSLIIAIQKIEHAERYKWKITWIENGIVIVDSFTDHFYENLFTETCKTQC